MSLFTFIHGVFDMFTFIVYALLESEIDSDCCS